MTICKVKDLECGQAWIYDDKLCHIESFPTRKMVVLRNAKPKSGFWSLRKESILEFRKTAKRIEGEW